MKYLIGFQQKSFALSVSGVLLLSVCNMALGLVTTIVLSRVLGVENYGLYIFAFGVVNLLLLPAEAGLPTLLMRETVKNRIGNQPRKVVAIISWSFGLIVSLSVIAGALWLLSGELFSESEIPTQLRNYSILLLLLLPVLHWAASVIQGLEKPIHYVFANGTLRPLILSIFVVSLAIFGSPTPEIVMLAHVGATLIALIWAISVAIFFLRKSQIVLSTDKSSFEHREWGKSLATFTMVNGVHLLNRRIDIVLIGALAAVAAVGQYNIALQLVTLILFAQTGINTVLGPKIVKAFKMKNWSELQSLVKTSVTISTVFATTTAIILILVGKPLISVIFGPEFTDVYPLALILSIGYVFSAAAGPTALLLNMTNNEKLSLFTGVAAAVVSIGLNLLLIPLYGAFGAAISACTALIFIQILRSAMVRKHLSIRPDIVFALLNSTKTNSGQSRL